METKKVELDGLTVTIGRMSFGALLSWEAMALTGDKEKPVVTDTPAVIAFYAETLLPECILEIETEEKKYRGKRGQPCVAIKPGEVTPDQYYLSDMGSARISKLVNEIITFTYEADRTFRESEEAKQ
jgi:hypothetical protein